jgi:hypothetical protein
MARRKELERWETKVRNCKDTPQAMWPIVKFLMKRDGPKALTIVHGPLGITYHSDENANAIAECFENLLISHDLCNENHKQREQTEV